MHRALPSEFFRRIVLFASLLLAAFAFAIAGLALVERGTRREIAENETAEQAHRFDGALRLSRQPLTMFTEAYARRVTFIRPRLVLDGASARTVLASALRTFRSDLVWVIEADDSLRHHVAREGLRPMLLPRLPDIADRPAAFQYYFVHDGVLHELSGRRLDADRRSPHDLPGWFLAARRLDDEALNAPSLPLEGRVTVLPLEGPASIPPAGTIQFDRLMPGFDGKPVARLRFVHESHELESVTSGRNARFLLMLGFATLLVAIMVFCLWRWVIKPATAMHRSLSADDPAPLSPLAAVGGDYARLAETLRTLLESRAALRHALAERARLDRDLHDGAIQSLFASGLSLTQARRLVPADPAAADRALAEVQDTLNRTIQELRSMLEELGPPADATRNFAEAATTVVTQVCAGEPRLAARVVIDEAAAVARPLADRIELLHFIREAATNVVRHARASSLKVTLRHMPAGAASLEIADDGVGFEPARVSNGRGLRNLPARAAVLGGTLVIDSAPGRGTRLLLELPPSARVNAGA